jgi:hypothetical protein
MPASATLNPTLVAWANLLAMPLVIGAALVMFGMGGKLDGDVIAKMPGVTIYPVVWIAAAAAFVGYGAATLIGKSYETA